MTQLISMQDTIGSFLLKNDNEKKNNDNDNERKSYHAGSRVEGECKGKSGREV